MGRRGKTASSYWPEQAPRPVFGAFHRVVDRRDDLGEGDDARRIFFSAVDDALGDIIKSTGVIDDRGVTIRQKKNYRVYDDLDKTSVSVLQRRVADQYAKKQRARLSPNDVGHINGKIEDEISRLELGCLPLDVAFTQVIRPTESSQGDGSRRIALILDQGSIGAELLVAEHKITVAGIRKAPRLAKFDYPFEEYVPHMSIVNVYKEAKVDQINAAVTAITEILPLEVQIEPIAFVARQEF